MTPLETVTTRANPLVDPALHVWGWEIVVYLFLGGLVAGLFVLAALLELRAGRAPRSRAFAAVPLLALGLLSTGMLALWLDLAHRFWAWRFYAAFRPTSPMSWGAWILVLVYPVGLLLWLSGIGEDAAARLPLSSSLAPLTAWARGHRRGLLHTAVAMGAGLGVYTGLLLGTLPARPLWNSALLGPLFLTSGISSGAALLALLASDEEERKTLVRWDALAIGAELAILALLFVGWSSGGAVAERAAAAFLGGPFTAVFWSFVVVAGLLVPLAMDLAEARRHLRFTAAGPVLVLLGGLALRWVLLVAGQGGVS